MSTRAQTPLRFLSAELDDEWDCSQTPWDSFGCPSRSVTASSTGDLEIWISQWGGYGGTPGTGACFEDAGYTLYVAVNGVPVTPTMTYDDNP